MIKLERKRYVTSWSIQDKCHIVIDANDPKGCFREAQKLHRLGEHRYIQVRLRSTKPSLKQYRWVNLVKWIGA